MYAPWDNMLEVDEGGGVTICVCRPHRLEYCHMCTVDYRDLNADAREARSLEDHVACWAVGCSRPGKKACKGCGRAKYCSKECQAEHWKTGGHRQGCRAAANPADASLPSPGQGASSALESTAGRRERGPKGFVPRTIPCFGGTSVQEYPPLTKVMLPDRSGSTPPKPLHGTIMSTNMDAWNDVVNERVPAYVIRLKGGTGHDVEDGTVEEVSCEEVHDEWHVVKASKLPLAPQ